MGHFEINWLLPKGPFKHYVSTGHGGWVCLLTVYREWVGGLENPPKHAYIIFEWSLMTVLSNIDPIDFGIESRHVRGFVYKGIKCSDVSFFWKHIFKHSFLLPRLRASRKIFHPNVD